MMTSSFSLGLRWAACALLTATSAMAQAQPGSVPTYQQQLEARAAETKECQGHARKAGLPPALVTAMYLIEVNSPAFFAEIPCAAARNGVSFRYQSGGMFGSEGFEIKGRSKVFIKVQREKMDVGGIILVPVHSTVNGHSQNVTRGNIQLLAFQLNKALRNE